MIMHFYCILNRRGYVNNINRIISYLTISMILVVGVVIVTGIAGDFDTKWRFIIGAVVGVYAAIRIWMLMRKPKPKSLIRPLDSEGDERD